MRAMAAVQANLGAVSSPSELWIREQKRAPHGLGVPSPIKDLWAFMLTTSLNLCRRCCSV